MALFRTGQLLKIPYNFVHPGQELDGFVVEKDLHTTRRVRVILCRRQTTNEQIVVKMYEKSQMNDPALRHLQRSILVHAELCNHPLILEMLEVIESDLLLLVVYEYCESGDIFSLVEKYHHLAVDAACAYMLQVAEAIHYMHSKGFVHRDIKPENILLTFNGNVKIGDFDLASTWRSDQVHTRWCGTTQYAAPELLSRRGYFGPEVDAWSLGVTMYVLLMGVFPFNEDFYRSRGECPAQHLLPMGSSVPVALQEVIVSLLEHSTEKRSTVLTFRRNLMKFMAEEYPTLFQLSSVRSSESLSKNGAPTSAGDSSERSPVGSQQSVSLVIRSNSDESNLSMASSQSSVDSDDGRHRRTEYIRRPEGSMSNPISPGMSRSFAKESGGVRQKLKSILRIHKYKQ